MSPIWPVLQAVTWKMIMAWMCDQPLPELPSRNLTAILAALEKCTYKDPTTDNPHHCMAPSICVFAGFCACHHFETHKIPNTIASGWPMQVNFGALFDYVSWLYLHLMEISKDGKNTFLLTAKEYYKTDQLRKQGVSAQFISLVLGSKFWMLWCQRIILICNPLSSYSEPGYHINHSQAPFFQKQHQDDQYLSSHIQCIG